MQVHTVKMCNSCRHQITKEIFQVPNFATRAHFLSSWQFMHHSLQNPTCQKEIPKAPELSQARQVGLVWCPAIAIKIAPSAPTQLENHFCKTAHLISFKLSFSLLLWPNSILAGYSSVISFCWLIKKCYLNSINQICSCSWPVSYVWVEMIQNPK